jgi:hypothetical protein
LQRNRDEDRRRDADAMAANEFASSVPVCILSGRDRQTREMPAHVLNCSTERYRRAGSLSRAFSALSDIHPLPHTRRIVVITGHTDACYEEAIRELKQRLEPQPKTATAKDAVALEMRFIGLALSAKGQPRLREIAKRLEAGRTSSTR